MSTLATAILDLLRAGHVVTVDQIAALLGAEHPQSWPRGVILQALVDLVASGGANPTRYAIADPPDAPPWNPSVGDWVDPSPDTMIDVTYCGWPRRVVAVYDDGTFAINAFEGVPGYRPQRHRPADFQRATERPPSLKCGQWTGEAPGFDIARGGRQCLHDRPCPTHTLAPPADADADDHLATRILADLVASGQARTVWDGGDSTRYAIADPPAPAPPAPGRDYAGLAPCPTCGEDGGVIAEHMTAAALSMRWIVYCADCPDDGQAPCGNGRTLSDAIRDWDRSAVAASLALLDARSCRLVRHQVPGYLPLRLPRPPPRKGARMTLLEKLEAIARATAATGLPADQMMIHRVDDDTAAQAVVLPGVEVGVQCWIGETYRDAGEITEVYRATVGVVNFVLFYPRQPSAAERERHARHECECPHRPVQP